MILLVSALVGLVAVTAWNTHQERKIAREMYALVRERTIHDLTPPTIAEIGAEWAVLNGDYDALPWNRPNQHANRHKSSNYPPMI